LEHRDVKHVVIEPGVTAIGDGTFQGRYELSSVFVVASVVFIGAYAFSDCERLTSVSLGDNLAVIGSLRCAHF
jgi:hypothetical protein